MQIVNNELLARESMSKFALNQLSNACPNTGVTWLLHLSRAANIRVKQGFFFHVRWRLAARFRFQVIACQIALEDFEGLLRRIGHLKKRPILGGNCPFVYQHVKVQDAVPVRRTVNHDADLLRQLLRLYQREHFEHLVQRPKSPRETTSALAR